MEYNDFKIASSESIEAMAREYNKALLKQGFMFVRLNDEKDEKQILIQSIKSALNNTMSLFKKIMEYSTQKKNYIDAEKLFDVVKEDLFDYFGFGEITISNVAIGKYDRSIFILIQNLSKIALNLICFKENYDSSANFKDVFKNIFTIIELLSE